MSRDSRAVKPLSAVIALMIVMALVIGTMSMGTGNVSRARRIAAQLQAAALAGPNPVAVPTSATSPGSGPAATAITPGSATPAGPAVNAPTHSGGSTATSPSSNSTGLNDGRSRASKASPSPSASAAASAPAAATMTAAPIAVPLRRQPTPTEIAQAISAVHSLVPFFTPTSTDIATAGNQVCTAFDQQQPMSQIRAQALNMVGAGSVAWMIPPSATDVAIKTLVALYCPANASKLA